MGRPSNSDENNSQANALHCKSLLRVRGVRGASSIRLLIEEQKKALESITTEAKEFFEECRKISLFCNITYMRVKIRYEGAEKFVLAKHHVPKMYFCYYLNKNMKGKRVDYFHWEEISDMLTKANASIEERMLHMKIYYSFSDFESRARAISDELKALIRLQKELLTILDFEGLSLKTLPDWFEEPI